MDLNRIQHSSSLSHTEGTPTTSFVKDKLNQDPRPLAQ